MTPSARSSPPKRIQRKRTKGWKMPENTVYVGRPSKWGNPYPVESDRSNEYFVLARYRDHLRFAFMLTKVVVELRGKNLACWCPIDRPCHADVLLELANR